jgi:hypothetical protein
MHIKKREEANWNRSDKHENTMIFLFLTW